MHTYLHHENKEAYYTTLHTTYLLYLSTSLLHLHACSVLQSCSQVFRKSQKRGHILTSWLRILDVAHSKRRSHWQIWTFGHFCRRKNIHLGVNGSLGCLPIGVDGKSIIPITSNGPPLGCFPVASDTFLPLFTPSRNLLRSRHSDPTPVKA